MNSRQLEGGDRPLASLADIRGPGPHFAKPILLRMEMELLIRLPMAGMDLVFRQSVGYARTILRPPLRRGRGSKTQMTFGKAVAGAASLSIVQMLGAIPVFRMLRRI
jgi:hypothetical protein